MDNPVQAAKDLFKDTLPHDITSPEVEAFYEGIESGMAAMYSHIVDIMKSSIKGGTPIQTMNIKLIKYLESVSENISTE